MKGGELPLWSCFAKAGQESVKLTAFGDLAEDLDQRGLGLGDVLTVHGRISLETWQGKDGTDRHALAIVMTRAEPLAAPEPRKPRKRSSPRPKPAAPAGGPESFDDPLSF